MGLLFSFLATVAFGVLGCVAKVAERRQANASAMVVILFAWATLVMGFRTMSLGAGFHLPLKAAGVAAVCGTCAAVAFLAFQTSIQFGKVSVGWLMMNLSSAVPAITSIVIYHELLTSLKIGALGLTLASLIFLFHGRRGEEELDQSSGQGSRHASWFLLMLVILLTNGMSSFGLKVIAGWGLPEAVKFPYLTVWYAAGLASIGLPAIFKGLQVRTKEIGWAGLMAALSMGGQVAMAIALEKNMPGHVVFPVAVGGSVFIVVLASWLFFGEKMKGSTAVGAFSGFAAIVLLGIS